MALGRDDLDRAIRFVEDALAEGAAPDAAREIQHEALQRRRQQETRTRVTQLLETGDWRGATTELARLRAAGDTEVADFDALVEALRGAEVERVEAERRVAEERKRHAGERASAQLAAQRDLGDHGRTAAGSPQATARRATEPTPAGSQAAAPTIAPALTRSTGSGQAATPIAAPTPVAIATPPPPAATPSAASAAVAPASKPDVGPGRPGRFRAGREAYLRDAPRLNARELAKLGPESGRPDVVRVVGLQRGDRPDHPSIPPADRTDVWYQIVWPPEDPGGRAFVHCSLLELDAAPRGSCDPPADLFPPR